MTTDDLTDPSAPLSPAPGAAQSQHQHGGPQDAELAALGIDPATLLDFSVNTNPYGPAQGMVEAIRAAAIDRYPDPTGQNARKAMASWLGVAAEEIALGNGAAELLWTLARSVSGPGTVTLIVEPTFSEFRRAARASGSRLVEWRARAEDGFAQDLGAISERARAEGAAAVYLSTPNTPTGVCLAAAELAAFAAAHPRLTLVLDQSFLSLSERFADAQVRMPANVVRVRSLTKEHAIPGIRVGYLLAPAELVSRLEQQRPAWMTSSLAQAAAIAAGQQQAFLHYTRTWLLEDRTRLLRGVRGAGLDALATSTVFFLVRVKNARELRRRLLVHHQILVRDCESFGLPEFIRVAVRPERDAARLVGALTQETAPC